MNFNISWAVHDLFGSRAALLHKMGLHAEASKQLGNKEPFYDAMERAMHNFLKAKLHIETSEMSKENIQELLVSKKAQHETVSNFMKLMDNCEFARYAPSTAVAMQQDYDKAVDVISNLSKQI